MTDRAQFEAMLEALINEDQEKAKEIFHNIVVGKSREIYEELLAEDFDVAEAAEEEEEEGVEEAAEEEEEAVEEGMDQGNPYADEEEEGEEEEEEGSEEGEEEGGDDHHADVGGEEELEDRVMDLEDALEDLKAEFEQLMAGEEHEEEQNPGIHGGELDGIDSFGGEDEVDEFAGLMEYTVKVPNPTHGDNGANAKSVVAGKNDMGGTAKNIAQSFSTTTGGTQGGLAKPSTELQDAGNINVPGAKAGKTAFTKKEPGHGAEKKGAGEHADNKQSVLKPLKK